FISCVFMIFFFQAEDGIRDATVTGVQTCALPISTPRSIGSRITRSTSTAAPRAARSSAPYRRRADALELDQRGKLEASPTLTWEASLHVRRPRATDYGSWRCRT